MSEQVRGNQVLEAQPPVTEAAPQPARTFKRLPRHIGIIPDGNRRWARERGMPAEEGYAEGLRRGIEMLDAVWNIGIEEVSVYGFTTENNHRPREQRDAFTEAVIGFAQAVQDRPVALQVIGNPDSPAFPPELIPLTESRVGRGPLRVNLLVNYGWHWDLEHALKNTKGRRDRPLMECLGSAAVSRIDLVLRWGGCQRLSGFLPVQSTYADFYFVDAYWPEYTDEDFFRALEWYESQDVTLGG